MKLLSRRAQSTGEYAILFAIVLGAVIAIQNYVRNRIAQRIMTQANLYSPATTALATSSDQTSRSSATMTGATQGTVRSGGTGTSVVQNVP